MHSRRRLTPEAIGIDNIAIVARYIQFNLYGVLYRNYIATVQCDVPNDDHSCTIQDSTMVWPVASSGRQKKAEAPNLIPCQ